MNEWIDWENRTRASKKRERERGWVYTKHNPKARSMNVLLLFYVCTLERTAYLPAAIDSSAQISVSNNNQKQHQRINTKCALQNNLAQPMSKEILLSSVSVLAFYLSFLVSLSLYYPIPCFASIHPPTYQNELRAKIDHKTQEKQTTDNDSHITQYTHTHPHIEWVSSHIYSI